MDAPPIQYARTEDGVNIAYWTLGVGPPIVHLHSHVVSHLDLEWEVPAFRSWYESMAEDFQVVRLNLRGGGLSDPVPENLGLAGYLRDINAVMDRLGLDQFALFGCWFASTIAIAY